MNKTVILLTFVLGLIFISSCSKRVIDCGTDTACFSKNFKTCTLSKIYGGATEIKGGTAQYCEIYFESAASELAKLDKMSMICTVKDTASYKDYEMNAVYVFEKKSECKGTLADTYSEIYKMAEDIQNKK